MVPSTPSKDNPLIPPGRNKVTIPQLLVMKREGQRIAALTAYDYPMAALVDAAGVDVILVGDSLGNVVLGYETTLPVTLDHTLTAVRAVRRGVRRALLVADLPFGWCHDGGSSNPALEGSIECIKAGAQAVKLEGGRSRCQLVRSLVDAAIPVMGHLGLTPQSVHTLGGYRVQGKTAEDAERLLEDALALEDAGVFALVVEGVPAEVAAQITQRIQVPTIGIGAGKGCDGQILVVTDLLGLTVPPPPEGPGKLEGKKPRFVRQYLNLRELIHGAVAQYASDVRSGEFPGDKEAYRLSEAESASVRSRSSSPLK